MRHLCSQVIACARLRQHTQHQEIVMASYLRHRLNSIAASIPEKTSSQHFLTFPAYKQYISKIHYLAVPSVQRQ